MKKNKIKVNFFLNTFLFGGIEKVILQYLKNLDHDVFDIHLIVGLNMGRAQVLIDQVPKAIKINYLVNLSFINKYKIKKVVTNQKLNICEKIIDSIIMRPLCSLLYKVNMSKIWRQADVLIDFGFSDKIYKANIPIISFMHFNLSSYLNWNENINSKKYKDFKTRLISRNQIIVINNDMKEEVIEKFPEVQDKLQVIYNPFDLDSILSIASVKVSDAIEIEDYILTVCRLEENQKDVTTLIKAFKLLVSGYDYKGKLVIVGDGSSKNDLIKLSIELNIDSKVIFLGAQLNPYCFMKKARVFVLSSKFEGFGNVIVEAMAVGVPVVATDCPVGPNEILQNGECGLLFEIGDCESLCLQMNSLLTNKDLANQLIENGKTRAKAFELITNVKKLERVLYECILEKN